VVGQKEVQRDLLIEQCLSGDTVVEAGAGFGKSAFLQLAAQTTGFVLVRRITEVLEAVAARTPRIAIDDVDSWDVADLAQLENTLTSNPGVTWLLSARQIPPLLQAAQSWARITTDDLRLDRDQVAHLLSDKISEVPILVDVVYDLSAGWPAAVNLIALQMQEEDPTVVARRLGRHNIAVESLVERMLRPVPGGLALARALSTLPQFDGHIGELLGEADIAERLQRAGVPIHVSGSGWVRILEPALSVLRANRDRIDFRPEIAAYFLERQEVHAAIDTYLAYGELEGAAELLSRLNRQQEAHLDPDKLHASVATMGDAIDAYPRAFYVHAHVSAVGGHSDEGLAALERGEAVFTRTDPSMRARGHAETLSMLGVWHVFDGRLSEAKAIIDRIETLNVQPSPHEQAMLHDLRGCLHHALATKPDLELATSELKAAYSLWRELKEHEAATVTLFRLAGGVLPGRGLRSEALAMLEDLPNLAPMTVETTRRVALERAELLPYLGRADEVAEAVAEASATSKLLGDDFSVVQAHIAEVVAASVLGDCDRVLELNRSLIDQGLLGASVTDGLWRIDIADALARCERWEEAAETTAAMVEIDNLPEWVVLYSLASIESRCGDPEKALSLLQELELRDDVEEDKRWQLQLYEATAHLRAGNADEATKMLSEAERSTSALGAPGLPSLIEAGLVEAIRAYAPRGRPLDTQIQIFGAFRVVRGPAVLAVPAGNASTLLKVLGSTAARLTVDQVVDALWPDTSLAVGRRRLRNVLSRVRNSCGEAIARDGDLLFLATNVRSDFAEACDAAESILAGSEFSVDFLDAAISRLDQPLLEGDRYEEWAENARDRQRELLVRLHEFGGAALATLDSVAALRHYRRAAVLDPFENSARRRAIETLSDA